MIQGNSRPTILGGSWGPPLVGLAGTLAGMLTAFARVGTEPEWQTALVSTLASVSFVGISLLLLKAANRGGR